MTNHEKIIQAIKNLNPQTTYSLSGDDLNTLKWKDTSKFFPTKAQIETEMLNVVPDPKIQEQLNAIFKGGQDLTDMKTRLGL